MKKVTIEFDEQELQFLVNLLDAGLRTQGLKVAKDVVYFMEKLENAMKELQKEN